MSAPVCLIVNPAAGGGKAGRLAPAVERALRGHGLAVRRADTRDLAHARELAGEAAEGGETVVALSGDGLIGVLADALRDIPGAVLGVLPGGRGNDLARVLGIPDDPEAACGDRRGGTRSAGRPRSRGGPGCRGRRTGVRGHRLGGLRQRRQPHRQRGARPGSAGSSTLTARSGARSLAAGAVRGRARPSGRAPRLLGYTDRRRQLQGLRRWHARGT